MLGTGAHPVPVGLGPAGGPRAELLRTNELWAPPQATQGQAQTSLAPAVPAVPLHLESMTILKTMKRTHDCSGSKRTRCLNPAAPTTLHWTQGRGSGGPGCQAHSWSGRRQPAGGPSGLGSGARGPGLGDCPFGPRCEGRRILEPREARPHLPRLPNSHGLRTARWPFSGEVPRVHRPDAPSLPRFPC